MPVLLLWTVCYKSHGVFGEQREGTIVKRVTSNFSFEPVTRRPAFMLVSAVLAGFVVGCIPPPSQELVKQLQQKLDRSQLENEQLSNRVEDQATALESQRRMVEDLRGFGPDRLAFLFVVDRIELASLSGGADYDGQPGDDGVTLYIRTMDRDGHVVKAAGEITVKLTDNSGTGPPRLLGLYVVNDFEELRRAWYGGFGTDHYTIKCPWQPGLEGRPRTGEVEVKVTFLDFLTGRLHSTNRVVKVALVGAG